MKKLLSLTDENAFKRMAQYAAKAPDGLENLTYAEVIRMVRNKLLMTQSQLAKRAGLPQSHIAKIESGKMNPRLDTLEKILKAMHCDMLLIPKPIHNLDKIIDERVRHIAPVKEEERKLRRNPTARIWDESDNDSRLRAAAKKIVEQGAFVAEPTNIRGGQSEPPYTWGPDAGYSHILMDLGVSDGSGKVLAPELLARLGVDSNSVAERWYNSDDPQFPSITKIGASNATGGKSSVLSLREVIERSPELALGQEHVAAFGPTIAMLMKDIDAAQPLSWQTHIGIAEGYEVQEMPEGTGLLLGPVEPGSDAERRRLIDHVRRMLEGRDKRVIGTREPVPGIETPMLFNEKGLDAFIDGLIRQMRDDMKIPELVKLLMLEGINVIDVMGFAKDAEGKLIPRDSLIQIYIPKPGERIVTRERKSHALFGNARAHGMGAVGWLMEFKQAPSGLRANAVASSELTWSLSDNFMGKSPRPGKVTRRRLEEAFSAMEMPDPNDTLRRPSWRAQNPNDFQASDNADALPKIISPGARQQRIHHEPEYSALKMFLTSGTRAVFSRNGRHSAFKVKRGAVRVTDLKGKVVIERLGFDGKGWDGTNSDEAVVLAHKGDLLLESVGTQAAVVYDAIRPIQGGKTLPGLMGAPA